MKTILIHPTGNENVRAAAKGLADAEMLHEFYTTIALFEGDFLDKLGNIGSLSVIRRRRFGRAFKPFIKTSPWREVARLIASKSGFLNFTRHETGKLSVDAIYRNLDKKVSANLEHAIKNGALAVYAYEDGAEFTFSKAKQLGLQCFYDLPIGYWRTARKLLAIEKERWPEWSSTLTGFLDSDEKLDRKDRELELADQIFVASRFTAETLKDFPGQLSPVNIISYGFPPVEKSRIHVNTARNKRLKLLFVGGLSQRKGIANLFKAVEKLSDHIELTIIGTKPDVKCLALETALSKHKWISTLAHNDVLKLMQHNDLLIFPSLFEGFGLVITEAMSQGTPVITTERTIGPDIIVQGENGWITEAGSTEALQSSIEEALCRRNSLHKIGQAAMETASLRPWDIYGQQLAEAVLKINRHNTG